MQSRSTPTVWDAALTIPVSGTQLGVTGQRGCSISTAMKGGVASCTGWFDYHTQVDIANPVAVSDTEQWAQSRGANFSQTTGGNQDTVSFIDQFQVSFAGNPSGAGTTNPSGSKVWEDYGSLPISAIPSEGYLFNIWSTDAGGISLTSPGRASTTATILGPGTLTATFSVPVTQPITLALAKQQGTPANFTLSGCSISPLTLPGDGKSHSFSALPSCQLTITVASGSPNVRYGFDTEDAISSTSSVMTCPEQTCSEYSTTYYEQVSQQFAYSVVGGAAPYVKAPALSYTALGSSASYTETGSPTAQWLDFGTSWSLTNPLPGSGGSQRWFALAGASGTATAGGENVTSYQRQYSVLIAASPADCGRTTPSGADWESAGDDFQITGTTDPGCTFSAWGVTGIVTIAQPGQLPTTAFADSNGTLTASFIRNAVPVFSTSELVLVLGGCAIAAAGIGTVLLVRVRVSRSRIPRQ